MAIQSALKIQKRTVSALVRRELIFLTQKSGLNFIVLLLEPMIFVLILSTIFIFRNTGLNGIPIAEFCISGYCILWSCRFHISKMVTAISDSAPLLYHRHVKIIDILIARGIIQCLSTTFCIFSLIPLTIFKIIAYPNAIYLVIFSWILVQFYGFTMALLAGSLAGAFKFGSRLCLILNGLHIFATGAFFMVYWLPPNVQKYIKIFPMVHATEMMRDGLFGNIIQTYYSTPYILISSTFLLFISLVIVKYISTRGYTQ